MLRRQVISKKAEKRMKAAGIKKKARLNGNFCEEEYEKCVKLYIQPALEKMEEEVRHLLKRRLNVKHHAPRQTLQTVQTVQTYRVHG